MDGSHSETIGRFLQRHRGRRLDALRREPGFTELRGERHRETSRMRCADEFLRIGALFVFETRPERIRSLMEHAAFGGNCAAAILEPTLPNSGSLSIHND